MNICDNNHDEICFNGRHCPLCAKIEEMEDAIREREKEVIELKEQIP